MSAPTFSIIVPVLDEAGIINQCVADIRRIDPERRCEIVVVDGDPGGGTIRVIEDNDVVKLTAARGRARQMNAGAKAAGGDVLVFLHADTRLPDTALGDMAALVSKPHAVGGAFRLHFDSRRWIYRAIGWILTARCRLSRMPFGDQAIFLKENYFRRMGGYDDIPFLEDVALVWRVRRNGDRLSIAPSRVTTSRRRFEADGIVTRVALNSLIVALYGLGVSPSRLAALYSNGRRRS